MVFREFAGLVQTTVQLNNVHRFCKVYTQVCMHAGKFHTFLRIYYLINYCTIIFAQRPCARGKAISFVCCLSVVTTKIATSRDLGTWATCKWMNPSKSAKNWLQYASIPLGWPTSVTNSAFSWPRLSTMPTANHVLSAHAHNWPSMCR